jgi:hypothetical protein
VATHKELAGEWAPVEAAVEAMSGRSQQPSDSTEKQQREALLKVHQRLVELGQERGTAYGAAFEAYMLHAGGRYAGGAGLSAVAAPAAALLPRSDCLQLPLQAHVNDSPGGRQQEWNACMYCYNKTCRRCPCCRLEREKGVEAAAAALLGAVVFALDAQQEAGAPAALRSMLAPAASVAAAVIGHAQQQKPARRLELSGATPPSACRCLRRCTPAAVDASESLLACAADDRRLPAPCCWSKPAFQPANPPLAPAASTGTAAAAASACRPHGCPGSPAAGMQQE